MHSQYVCRIFIDRNHSKKKRKKEKKLKTINTKRTSYAGTPRYATSKSLKALPYQRTFCLQVWEQVHWTNFLTTTSPHHTRNDVCVHGRGDPDHRPPRQSTDHLEPKNGSIKDLPLSVSYGRILKTSCGGCT